MPCISVRHRPRQGVDFRLMIGSLNRFNTMRKENMKSLFFAKRGNIGASGWGGFILLTYWVCWGGVELLRGQCNPAGNPTRYEYTLTPVSSLNLAGLQFCTSQSSGNNCCGGPADRCLDLIFHLQNGPNGEMFDASCRGQVSLMTAQGNFSAMFLAVGAPNPAGNNVNCGAPVPLGNNYTISLSFNGTPGGNVSAHLEVFNAAGTSVFGNTQAVSPGQAVMLTLCKPGFGCVMDEIVFGCCAAEASLALHTGASDTLCAGQSTVLKIVGQNGMPPYTVTVRAATATDTSYLNVVVPSDGDSLALRDTILVPVSPTKATTYCAVSVQDAAGCTQPVTSNNKAAITVVPTPQINPLEDIVVCAGASVPPTVFTSPTPGAVFQWTSSNPAIGLPSSGTGALPAFTALNPGTTPLSATITVTPLLVWGSKTCTGTPFSFNFIVNPTPSVNAVNNQVVCTGQATQTVVFSSPVAGSVFHWTNSLPAIGLPSSGTGNIATFTAQNPGTAVITVTPSFTHAGVTCSGTPSSFTITADPPAGVFAGFDQVICQNQVATLSATLSGSATGGTWSGGAGVFAQPNSPTTTYTPAPTEYGTTLTLTFTTNDPPGPCPAASDDINITVNTAPIVYAGADVAICQKDNLSLSALGAYILANGSGITTGTWSTGGTGTFWPTNSFPGATTYIPSAADRTAGFVLLTLTSADPAGPCTPITDQVKLSFVSPSSLTCNDKVIVALDQTGMAVITPDMLLEAPQPDGIYRVEVFVNGVNIGDKVDCSHIGKNVVGKVTDLCTGVWCTTTIMVMDNLPPKVTCTDVTLVCAVMNYTPAALAALGIPNVYPEVEENCGAFDLTYFDLWQDLPCSAPYIGYALRTWTASDARGLKATCSQYIYFEHQGLDAVKIPANITLTCSNGAPDTSIQATGMPFISAYGVDFPIFPPSKAGACRLSVSYADKVFSMCPGSYNVIREWTVLDWCRPVVTAGPNANPRTFAQLISVLDQSGPTFLNCPDNLTVSTDPLTCCATAALPAVRLRDGCAGVRVVKAIVHVRHPVTGDVLQTLEVPAALNPATGAPGTEQQAAFALTACLPIGTHTVIYHAEDNCNNTSTCSFSLSVQDLMPPQVSCTEVTQVALGINGMALVNAATFNSGSYDACGQVYFKARRMESNNCQPITHFVDQVKFCCEDIGDTVEVILRVYDAPPPAGPVPLDFAAGNFNECIVQVYVEDKLKPTCVPPANTTVSCEHFDPSLWAYGTAGGTDNCCVDTIITTVNYQQFDTLCNRGTIARTFRVVDCGGQSSTCSQRIVVQYQSGFFVRFPNDLLLTECNSPFDNFGQPEFFGVDCEHLGISYEDKRFTVVPDACFKIERTWTIINWCTYNPNAGCIVVPNPNPNALSEHPSNFVGPTVSPLGTPAPWAPTVVRIAPTDPQATNFSTFWSANPNCYRYTQVIKVRDTKVPTLQCPAAPVEACDLSANDPHLWNAPSWYDALTGSHDLCEGAVDLCISATDACSGPDLKVRFLLFLDLNNDGTMETVVSSTNPPPPGAVLFGNAVNPNYSGGSLRPFDLRNVPDARKYRFALETITAGNNLVACLRWNTLDNPQQYVLPQLPYGTHKIKWFVEDGCGNEQVCEHLFTVKDCKRPTVVCLNGISVNLMPTKMVSVDYGTLLKDADDNCTPKNLLIFGLRRSGTGTGFPFRPDGNPQTAVTFDCTQLGFNLVQLWTMDLSGNADFCETYVHVQDNAGVCTNTNAAVAGVIQSETGKGVEDVTLLLSVLSAQGAAGLQTLTEADGYFHLPNVLPREGTTVIKPYKNDDPLNGVSTFDLVLINRHILGIEPLNSPYKMLAADVNNSRSITTADILELRKLILGLYNELPGSPSWRFVDRNYLFPDPTNPFKEPFPEQRNITDPTDDRLSEDFIAVKIGDVNGSAVTNSWTHAEYRTAGTLFLEVEDRPLRRGETFTVHLRPERPVGGYQFTLNYGGLQLVDIPEGQGMGMEHFGIHVQEQALAVACETSAASAGFSLTLRAEADGWLHQFLQVSSKITRAEAYPLDIPDGGSKTERLDVALRFNNGSLAHVSGVGFELYQNCPNPWTQRTQVGFHLPADEPATFTVYDETGRIRFRHTAQYPRGYHVLTLDNEAVGLSSGALFYRLETPTHSAVRRMLKL